MKGSIQKRGKGTYRLRISPGRDQNGKLIQHSKTVHGTRKVADRALRDWVDQYEAGRLPTGDKVVLSQFLAEWLDVAKSTQVTSRTLADYRATLKTYIEDDLGRLPLGKITVLDVQAHMTAMFQRGLSAKTVRGVHGLLSQALKCAVRWKRIAFNPCADVEKPRVNRKKQPVKAFNQEQLARFLAGAMETPHAVLFELAVTSGMRPGEYLGLGWDCVDWEADGVRVERAAIYERHVKPYLGQPKTPESYRTIPLPKPLMQRLREHKTNQNEWRLRKGEAWDGALNLVFPNQFGKLMDYHNIAGRGFKAVCARVGLPKEFSLYDLRHTCATLLLLAGENPKVVQERLGHASIIQTLDTYSHVLPTLQRGAADKLGGLIYGA